MAESPVAAVWAELDRLTAGIGPGIIGVAVSGGGDSTALLLIAARWTRDRGWRLAAATVDHGLRPESAAEAAGVAGQCAELGIPHETLPAGDLAAAAGNLSAAAREARLELLSAWAARLGLASVLLGHTLDDQAETVLMRLARGSGVEGLSGMQADLCWRGTRWLRPLLGVRRADLRGFLLAEGFSWAEDPTNENPGYDRVKARAALATLAPLGIDAGGLAETALRLQRQRRVLERAMARLADRARCWGGLGEVRLDPAELAADEADTALRLLADTLQRLSGAAYPPRYRALAALLGRMLAGADADATLAGCVIRRRTGGPVLVCREPDACAGPVAPEDGSVTWDGRWVLRPRGGWPAEAIVGALGEAGISALKAVARSGAWHPPAAWQAAPAVVRQTTPALWRCSGGEAPVLVSAPLAGYRTEGAGGADPVEILPAEGLRAGAAPAYVLHAAAGPSS